MTDILVKIKNLSIITIIASLIIGLVLIIRPGETLQIVSLICGVSVILLGIAAWIIYFVKDNSMFMAVLGTISLIADVNLLMDENGFGGFRYIEHVLNTKA